MQIDEAQIHQLVGIINQVAINLNLLMNKLDQVVDKLNQIDPAQIQKILNDSEQVVARVNTLVTNAAAFSAKFK